jgi:Flp pilus assembly protein TadB
MPEWIVLSVVLGLSIAILFWGLTARYAGGVRALQLRQKSLMRHGIQVRLDEAQLDLRADQFVARSLALGCAVGFGLFFFVGAIVLVPIGLLAGVLVTWTELERKRDQRLIDYNQRLASACDTLRNAYLTTGSLTNALKAVVDYGQQPVSEDFLLILTAARQGEFAAGLQTVADRRRSIVFDAVANALLRAEESSGAVGEMLERLSEATRQNVAAFETAIIQQINARSNVNWGAFGPWLVFGVFRLFTTGFGDGFLALPEYFTTLAGNIVAGLAGALTIGLHRWCFRIAQRELSVQRIGTSDPGSFVTGAPAARMPGYAPGLSPTLAGRMRQRPLNTQG